MAFLEKDDAQDVLRGVVVLRHFKRMPGKCFHVLPIGKLAAGEGDTGERRREGQRREDQGLITKTAGQVIRAPDQEGEDTD